MFLSDAALRLSHTTMLSHETGNQIAKTYDTHIKPFALHYQQWRNRTMTEPIKLPLLPEWLQEQQDMDTAYPVSTIVTAMKQYATAAVKAERWQRHLKERAQLNQEWSTLKGMQAQYEAALQSQDREDADWMVCESRRPWVTNSLKHHIKELRDAEKRSRNAFKKDYMGEPARYFADACAEAASVIEAKLAAIDHARRIEGEGE
jgi:hypothetical protein